MPVLFQKVVYIVYGILRITLSVPFSESWERERFLCSFLQIPDYLDHPILPDISFSPYDDISRVPN